MASKALIIAGIIAYVEARFGQEQIPVAAIQALGDFGEPGAAATLAGQVPSSLLAGASACDKLALADEIVAQLGDDQAVIDAALGLVAAEQNFNDFADDTGRICNDASLPATAALRGVIPLFDPQVAGSEIQNANSAASLANPLNADGLSVADLSRDGGFANFNEQDAAGTVTVTAVADGADVAAAADVDAAVEAADEADVSDAAECAVVEVEADAEEAAADDAAADDAAAAADVDVGGAVFGNCDLTVARLPNTEFANRLGAGDAGRFFFQSNDDLIANGQQEALNGNIVTNAICNGIVNVCGGNAEAVDLCQAAQADVEASVADANSEQLADEFNAAIANLVASA